MPQIIDFQLEPKTIRIKKDETRAVTVKFRVRSMKKFNLVLSLAKANNFMFEFPDNAEVLHVSKIRSYNNLQGSAGAIEFERDVNIKLIEADPSIAIFINARIEDNVSSSDTIPSRLNISK